MRVENVCVLGATGSIGVNTLDVIERHPERYRPFALSAHTNVEEMLALCRKHRPEMVVMACDKAARQLEDLLKKELLDIEVAAGAEALQDIAAHPDVSIVMAAIVGAAGLLPNLAAVKAGKKVLLANKESLVMSGGLFMSEARQSGAILLPIDSEHNAIFQCLPEQYHCGQTVPPEIGRILLTASGGPFRNHSMEQLERVTAQEACRHPNWSMGQKISVDSATLMNKGLELIEACWLFNIGPEKIEVHIHPESVIHSMVEYIDGSVLAQLGNPDMRTPIAYGLAWPERIDSGVGALDLFAVGQLNFEAPDLKRFPCLKLAGEAYLEGNAACTILNAANEVAVQAFLKGNIGFTVIPDIIKRVLGEVQNRDADSIEAILLADRLAREAAVKWVS